jgi:hypothetical protein
MTSRRAQEIRTGLTQLHAADPVLAQLIDDHPDGRLSDAELDKLPDEEPAAGLRKPGPPAT